MHFHINIHETKALRVGKARLEKAFSLYIDRWALMMQLKGSSSPLLFRRERFPLKIHSRRMTGRTKQPVPR